jgi:hypothetical protein
MGQAEPDFHDRTSRTELLVQCCQDRSVKIGLPAQDCKDKTRKEKTARKGKACKAARTGQLEQDSQNVTGRTRLQGQN